MKLSEEAVREASKMTVKWRRMVCWFKGHVWKVVDKKRHCVYCNHRPEDKDVIFCPLCGSERIMGHIMISDGYQYVSCMKCDHKFQDQEMGTVTVTHSQGTYELDKPEVDQEGNPTERENNNDR